MTDDEILATLRAALALAEHDAARYRTAIEALEGGPSTTAAEITDRLDEPAAKPNPPAKRRGRPPGKRRPAGGEHRCDRCGQTFSRPNGLTRHLNQTHGATAPPAPTPRLAVVEKLPDVPSGLGRIEPTRFDPDKARERAASGANW